MSIFKYDIKTKKTTLFWNNENSKTLIQKMIYYNNKIYLGSINGGCMILYDKNKIKDIDIYNSVTDMKLYNNYLWISTLNNFYKYNLQTKK